MRLVPDQDPLKIVTAYEKVLAIAAQRTSRSNSPGMDWPARFWFPAKGTPCNSPLSL